MNIDHAVDQSRLIRVGYAVVALMVLFAAYTIFSPKDVFQSVKRVSVPWANIERPSRVTIDDVQPGDTEVILGNRVRVSARILGAASDDTVRLFYTTIDNQTVDRAVPMQLQPTERGQRFTCIIFDDSLGVQQHLRYRIEAGDATSPEFQVTVMRTPSIVVDSIEYEYPPYTRMPKHTSQDDYEIRAVEGTDVTVHAKANHEIQRAWIEFDPDGTADIASDLMKPEGNLASCTFTLKWDYEANTPEHASYQIAFEPKLSDGSGDRVEGQLSAVHKILVTPDLPPEISILTPRRRDTDVPVNGMQRIEIRALDPDFGLTEITLRVRDQDSLDLLTVPLFQDEKGQTGQEQQQYEFRPRSLKLQPGDRVKLWAEAKDNYPQADSPRQSVASTPEYWLNIVPADPTRADQSAGRDEHTDDSRSQDDSPKTPPTSPQSDSQGSNQPQPDKSADDSPQAEQGDSAEDGTDQQQSESGDQSGDAQADANEEGDEGDSGSESSGQPQESDQGEEAEGSQTGQGGQQESGSSGGDAGKQSGDQGGGGPGGSSGNSGRQEGSAGDQSGQTDGQRSSSTDDSGEGTDGRGADPGASGQQDTREEPLHDGEAFERARDYLKKTGQAGDPTQDNADGQRQPASQSKPDGQSGDRAQRDGTDGRESSSDVTRDDSRQSDAQSNPNDPNPDASGSDGRNSDPQQDSGEPTAQPQPAEGSESPDENRTATEQRQPDLGDEGTAVDGRESQGQEGSVESQETNRGRDKTAQPDGQASSDRDVPSPGQSKTQPDSQSSQGDQMGSGDAAGGQSGRDAAGGNTSSDQGNTGSRESADGEVADRGGQRQQSADKTGSSGQDPGAESQTRAAPDGQQEMPEGAEHQTPRNPDQVASPNEADQGDSNSRSSGGLSRGAPKAVGFPTIQPAARANPIAKSPRPMRPIWSMHARQPTWYWSG